MGFACIRRWLFFIFCLICGCFLVFPFLVLLVSSSKIVFIFKISTIFSGIMSFHSLSLLFSVEILLELFKIS